MRVMAIPPFPRKFENPDLENLLRSRLSQTVLLWPDQAIPLLAYMCHPNDPPAGDALRRTLLSWSQASEAAQFAIPDKLDRIQTEWLRIADIFHLHFDLVAGRHQARRGGPSIGKAITLVDANAKSWGTGASTLWKIWSVYRDVAHLVAAAILICADARARYRNKPLGPLGLNLNQFLPFKMAMLMPDLVLAVALEFERVGLSVASRGHTKPTLNSRTLWRIPPNINVQPLPPPARQIRPQDLMVLHNRRAGNRGKANVRKTNPVSG